MNGAMFIAECLRQEGVTKVFGQCGHTNYALIDACHKIGIEYISFRHEQQAVHAADAPTQPEASAAQPRAVMTSDQVVQVLDETVDWYRTLGVQQQA